MAIYKLGDLFRVSDGEHGNVLFGQFSIPFIRVKDFDNLPNTDKFISEKEFDRINKRTDLRKNDILLSSVGTIGEVRLNNWDKIGLARSIITIRTRDEGRALTKFLFYILKTKFVELNSLAKGSAQKVLSLSDVRKLDIDVPSLEQQKQIIDIIEQNEKLFLTYSNCVRIDSIDNVQSDMKKLIDIIEPIENLRKQLVLQEQLMSKFVFHKIQELTKNTSITSIAKLTKYSKLIKSSELSSKGQYYYSTGKTLNGSKKVNVFNFEHGVSIPYEGAGLEQYGNFLPMLHDQKIFLARKWGITSEYPFTIYYSLMVTSAYQATSTGVKMPTLNEKLLSSCNVFDDYKEIEPQLKHFFYVSKKIKTQIVKIDKLIGDFINILIV